MKRIFYTLFFSLFLTATSFAQEEDGTKVRERMQEYIQKKLGLSRNEAERFGPIFLDYFKELRRTNQEFRGDRLVLQQKIVELRLKFRDQFKPIIGEKRSNDVFTHEREFVDEVKRLRQERLQDRPNGRAGTRKNLGL